jgi:hypothetical protein
MISGPGGVDGGPLIEISRERGWLVRVASGLAGSECATLVTKMAAAAGMQLSGEDVGSVRRAMQDVRTRATPGFVAVLIALLRAANPSGEPSLTRMVLGSLLQVEDVGGLYAVLIDRLEDRARAWQPGLLRDVMSLLRLSAHGMSATELIHVLALSRTSFSSVFGGFTDVLFQRLGVGSREGRPGADDHQVRLNLSCDALRDVIAARYLSDPDDVLRIRHVLVAHFGGFVTAIRYPSIESVVHCASDGEFARGCSELCFGFLNGVDRSDVLDTVSDVSVFRALWSSDLRRDLYRLWQDASTDAEAPHGPGESYWETVMTVYWDSINSDGTMDGTVRPVFHDLLVDVSDLCMTLYDEHVYKFLDLAVELAEHAPPSAAAGADLGALHHRLGVFYRTVGRPDPALDHFYQAFQQRLEHLGPCEDTVASIVDCGEILLDQSSAADAAAAFAQASALSDAAGIAEFSPSHARLLNDVGLLARREGNMARAEQCYRDSLEVRRVSGALVHPHAAVTLRNLGAVLHRLGRNKEAKSIFQRALQVSNIVHGPLHLGTMACHEWLAAVLGALDDPEGAVHQAMAERIKEKVERLKNQFIDEHGGAEEELIGIGPDADNAAPQQQ